MRAAFYDANICAEKKKIINRQKTAKTREGLKGEKNCCLTLDILA